MTKRDIVEKVASLTGLSQREVKGVLQASVDVIQESLVRGESVHFRGFGIFHVLERRAKKGRNPKRPEEDILIPARKTVKFKPGSDLKTQLAALDGSRP